MYKQLHEALLNWYKEHGRHELPWRQTDDAYAIYISEIMLQQTQVKTVLERFYTPFLEHFDTFKRLSEAPLDEVLKVWEGLGYYRRAKHLHEAAQKAQGVMPQSIKGLLSLKGVGQSTAHAIACFAFKEPVPILDANVKRILYRFFALKKASPKALWAYAWKLFDASHAYEYNQALMDLGSLICTKKPLCEVCPLNEGCLAAKSNPLAYPQKTPKKVTPIKQSHIVIYQCANRLGLYQRAGSFLHGLWGFKEQNHPPKKAIQLGTIKHKYSHFHLEAKVYLKESCPEGLKWFEREELRSAALSKADYLALACYDGLTLPQSI